MIGVNARSMWHESEKGLPSFFSMELDKSKQKSNMRADCLKRLQVMAKVYQSNKIKYFPWYARPKYLMDKNKIKSTSGDPAYD
jgi:hypothetical protein